MHCRKSKRFSILHFNTIASGSTNNLDDYQEQWKSAISPYVLSELRGNKLQRGYLDL